MGLQIVSALRQADMDLAIFVITFTCLVAIVPGLPG